MRNVSPWRVKSSSVSQSKIKKSGRDRRELNYTENRVSFKRNEELEEERIQWFVLLNVMSSISKEYIEDWHLMMVEGKRHYDAFEEM